MHPVRQKNPSPAQEYAVLSHGWVPGRTEIGAPVRWSSASAAWTYFVLLGLLWGLGLGLGLGFRV